MAYAGAHSEIYDTYTISSATLAAGTPVVVTVAWRVSGSFSARVPATPAGDERGSVSFQVDPRGYGLYQVVKGFASSQGTRVDESGVKLVDTVVGASIKLHTTLAAQVTHPSANYTEVLAPLVANFSASAVLVSSDPNVVVTGTAHSGGFAPLVPFAWGDNSHGQLGDGTNTQRLTPVQVSGLADVIDIAGAGRHTLAVRRDGSIWAWGENANGKLGNGSLFLPSWVPTQVLGAGGIGFFTDAIAVAAGGGHSLALKKDGTVWAWGDNFLGELGDNTTTNQAVPVQVGGSGAGSLTGVVAIAADHSLGAHSLALKSDGTVWAWGSNSLGQLGGGNGVGPYSVAPVKTVGLADVIAIAAGENHSLALKSDGSVWAWGYNGFGMLGDHTTIDRSTPVAVLRPGGIALNDVIAIAAGNSHSLALQSDGAIWAWGANLAGELGGIPSSSIPIKLTGPGATNFLTGAIGIAGGGNSLALKDDGSAWAWGANSQGQLGDGTTTDSSTAVKVNGLSDVEAVAAGWAYSLALVRANTVVGAPVVTPVDPATGASPVTLTFSNVTHPGVSSLSVGTDGPQPPAGFQLGNGLYYNITSTATFSSVNVCIDYSGTALAGTKPILQHYDAAAGGWTTANNASYTPPPPDDTKVCATFTSLSPFALMQAVDHTPPTVTCSVSPNVLSPPNHRMVPVTAVVTVTDDVSGPAGFMLTSATSNEADDGVADGDRANDLQGFEIGSASTTGWLRAERSAHGRGRIYTLTYTGRDVAGNSASCTAAVTVPHDHRGTGK